MNPERAENARTPIDAVSCSGPSEWPGDVNGRVCFLAALRRCRPEFWQSLHAVWLSRDNLRLESWARAHGIVDEWFLVVVLDTVNAWEQSPDGPNAQLAADYPWYAYMDEMDFPEFSPRLSDPFPKITAKHPDHGSALYCSGSKLVEIAKVTRWESLEEFEKRVTAEFRQQLKGYVSNVKKMMNYGTSPERAKHAEWTARMFTGETAAAVAEGVFEGPRGDPQKTVEVAVRRFARAIGLTMPGR